MTAAEEWRDVPGFPDYRVSNLGRVVSHKPNAPGKRPRVLRGSVHPIGGYVLYCLRSEDRKWTAPGHQLVAYAFLGPRPHWAEHIRHLDGNPANNTASNLTYGTRSDNVHDAVFHGTHNKARNTHCPSGHLYPPFEPGGHRRCQECRRGETARYRERKAA